jgi:hypothetical protein
MPELKASGQKATAERMMVSPRPGGELLGAELRLHTD